MCRRVLGMMLCLFATLPVSGAQDPRSPGIPPVLQPGGSPLVAFRILFLTGSAFDPAGKEGLAALTAAVLNQSGSQRMTRDQILATLYPTAANIDVQVDKEMTVFSGSVHREALDTFYSVLKEILLDPGWRPADFQRVRENTLNFLKTSLRHSNDEELGKEHLYNVIHAGHPYGHHNRGSVRSVEKLELSDVRDFYTRFYTRANLLIGLAGGYPEEFAGRISADFSGGLPPGTRNTLPLPAPELPAGTRIEIIQRETDATALSFGFPIAVTRGDADWPALALAASYLGQHRSSNGQLYRKMREERGLNYGDYAYIEYFPNGSSQLTPSPNLGRRQQIFQIWVRPVEPENAFFALRASLYEFDKLLREGISQADFEITREFLVKYASVMTSTQSSVLGYAMDSWFYGIPEFRTYVREGLSKLTADEVNAAIRRHLKRDTMRIVFVTRDAAGLKNQLVSGTSAPIRYNAPKSTDLLDEDKIIERYPVPVAPENVTVVPADQLFQ